MIDFMAALNRQPVLSGQVVAVEPADMSHVADLQRVVTDGDLFDLIYTGVPRPEDLESSLADALQKSAKGEHKIYVVRELASGEIVGCTRFYDLDPSVPKLAIGYTYYARRVQRTAVNTETKLLMLEFAFEVAGAQAVVFHTSYQNLASRQAIARLGARQDGVLRADKRHKDGTLRDTVVFSILQHEWPAVRSQLISKLGRPAGGDPA